MKFSQIRSDTFSKLQMNAGILATAFEPSTGTLSEANILGATTGGINVSITRDYTDMGEDIDNCPKNTKELKRAEDWVAVISGTFVAVDAAAVTRLLNATDSASPTPQLATITPSNDLSQDAFNDLWFIGDYSDVNTGTGAGFLAVHISNALSTGGFQIQTTDKDKGQFAFEFTGHYSIENPSVVPVAVYIKAGVA